MTRGILSPAARISLIYLIVGAIWVTTSDSVVEWLFGASQTSFTLAQTLKGWSFVGVTAAVLYVLLRREFAARQRSERMARASEANFYELFANNPLPMYIFDRETLAFLEVNEVMCAHYGYSRGEFLAMRITDIRPPDEVSRLLSHISDLGDNVQVSGDWLHRTKEGQIINVQITAQPFVLANRPVALVIAQDVTIADAPKPSGSKTRNYASRLSRKINCKRCAAASCRWSRTSFAAR